MYIKRVTMDGWCQHKHLVMDLAPGTNGIFGNNGAGKSNAVMAAFAGITGEMFSGNIHENIGRLEDCAVVEVVADISGKEMVVTRKFSAPWETVKDENNVDVVQRAAPKSTAEMRFGREKIKGAAAVTDKVFDLLGMGPKMFSSYVFIGQDNLNDLLFQGPADRMKAFMLLRPELERVDGIVKQLSKEIDRTPSVVVFGMTGGEDESRAAMTGAVSDVEAAIGAERARLEKLAEDLKGIDVQGITKALDCDRQASEAVVAVTALMEELPGDEEGLRAAWLRSSDLATLLSQTDGRLSCLRGDYDKVHAAAAAAEANDKAFKAKTRAEEAVAALEAEKERLLRGKPVKPSKPSNYDDMVASLADIKGEISGIDKVLSILASEVPKCPTCGTVFKDPARTRESNVGQRTELVSVADNLSAVIARVNALDNAYAYSLAAFTKDMALVEAGLQSNKDTAEMYKDVTRPDMSAVDKAAAIQSAILRETGGRRETAAAAGECDKRAATLAAIVSRKRKDIADLGARAGMALQPAVRDAYRKLLDKAGEIGRESGFCQGKIQQLEVSLAAAREALRQFCEQTERAGRVNRYRGLLGTAKSILHRNNLPRRVLSAYTGRIVKACNEKLEFFGRPFVIDITSDAELTVTFKDGYVLRNPKRLSGGQKCVLSTAFRIAFAMPSIGICVLDEPTAAMDKANVSMLADLISGINMSARNSGMQFIIITHAGELRGAFDRTIGI